MRQQHTQTVSVILLVVGLLSLAALACTSDSPEWLIPRTATPTATRTPVPVDTSTAMFQVGDALRIRQTGAFFIYQTNEPEPDTSRNRVIGSNCFPSQSVTVEEIAADEDGNFYYRVTCTLDGWVPEDVLEVAE